jgi:hypothetical protein
VIHVVAANTAKGEHQMTTSITEEMETAQATASGEPPKANAKANVAPRKPRVAPSKGKSVKKATPAKKGAKAAKVAKTAKKPTGARGGSKTCIRTESHSRANRRQNK